MTIPPVRVPLTLAAALAFHVSMSPPTSAPSLTSTLGQPGDRQAICATARFLSAILTKGLFWASALTDTLVVLAPHVPTALPILSSLSILPTGVIAWIRSPTILGLNASLALPVGVLSSLPLATVTGTALAIAGALVRRAAFDALGQFYACPNPGPSACEKSRGASHGHAHALITTGPYASVRHPGYAGLLLCTVGLAMTHFDALGVQLGSSVTWPWGVGESGMGGASDGMRMVALACALLATVGAIRRIGAEEQALRVRFKGEWEAWAERVRYKLIPGVY